MGLSSKTRFGFGYTVRLWALGLYVRESIANAGMRHSFGIVQLSGKPGEKREAVVVKLAKSFPAPGCDRFKCEFLGVFPFRFTICHSSWIVSRSKSKTPPQSYCQIGKIFTVNSCRWQRGYFLQVGRKRPYRPAYQATKERSLWLIGGLCPAMLTLNRACRLGEARYHRIWHCGPGLTEAWLTCSVWNTGCFHIIFRLEEGNRFRFLLVLIVGGH